LRVMMTYWIYWLRLLMITMIQTCLFEVAFPGR